MDVLANLALGFQTAMSLSNLLYCLIGVFLGTAVGVLPGIGPIATIAMLLPITFGLPPVSALIMLSGIYYGAQYGGSTTAILINLPGESASVVTALDGYRMARQGQAGLALATAAIGSFIAGTVATVLVALFAPPLAEVALKFGPAEYFSLMVLGLVASIVLASGSLLHALGMVVVGLTLGLVGTDVNSGIARFSFGFPQLADGIGFVVIAMGMFGLAEIVANLEHEATRTSAITHVKGLLPSREDWKRILGPIWRGTVARLGARHPAGRRRDPRLVCLLFAGKEAVEDAGEIRPGRGRRRRRARSGQQRRRADLVHPDADLGHSGQSGDGADDRRADDPGHPAGPDHHHRAGDAVLGRGGVDVGRQRVPADPQPAADRPVGPHDHGAVSPALSGDHRVLRDRRLFDQQHHFDVYLMVLFGLLGYVFRKLGCEPTPLLLGFILGPPMEEYLRRALVLSEGRPDVLLREPVSACLLAVAAVLLASVLLPAIRKKREETFVSESLIYRTGSAKARSGRSRNSKNLRTMPGAIAEIGLTTGRGLAVEPLTS